jgi:hypothetical protein
MNKAWLIAAVLLLAGPAAAQDPASPTMSWQDAVGLLAAERTRAEGCVTMLKRYAKDDPAALDQGQAAYTEAKADIDGVIAGLSVALAQADAPEDFSGLQAGLEKGVAARIVFCKQALQLAPPAEPGTKNALIALLGGAIEPLITAAKEIFLDYRKAGALERATIATQLEATKWRDFSAIES